MPFRVDIARDADMARHRHPFTIGLPLEEWPELDRKAWEIANRDGDLLTGRGPAAKWRPKTRLTARKAYRNWLRFLKDTDRLENVSSIGSRLNEENQRDALHERSDKEIRDKLSSGELSDRKASTARAILRRRRQERWQAWFNRHEWLAALLTTLGLAGIFSIGRSASDEGSE
jgi:hypothetical protein